MKPIIFAASLLLSTYLTLVLLVIRDVTHRCDGDLIEWERLRVAKWN